VEKQLRVKAYVKGKRNLVNSFGFEKKYYRLFLELIWWTEIMRGSIGRNLFAI
jgi:hypothetical protein